MDICALLGKMTGQPRPALIYSRDGERVELSYHVIANWIIKIANLLTLDQGVAPGEKILLDLPLHWRSLVWTAGSWIAGMKVITADQQCDDDSVDIWVGSEEKKAQHIIDAGFEGDIFLQALPSLALSWPGQLPPGCEDATQSIMSCADALMQPACSQVAIDSEFDSFFSSLSQKNIRQEPLIIADNGDIGLLDLTKMSLCAWYYGHCVYLTSQAGVEQARTEGGVVVPLPKPA